MKALVALFTAVLIGIAGPSAAETKDHLPSQQMIQMVAEPLSLARTSRLDTAEKQFEARYREIAAKSGSNSKEVADLLYAFGSGLSIANVEMRRPELGQAAVPYLRRAITVGRGAWGAQSPELALVLTDYAMTERWAPEGPAADALPSLREALKIRRTALGAEDPETRATEEMIRRWTIAFDEAPADPPTLDSVMKKGEGKLTLAHTEGDSAPDPILSLAALIGFMALLIAALARHFGGKAGRNP